MATYTVRISPEATGGAETIIRVDVKGGVAHIREFVVRPSGDGDATEQLSGLDFDLLTRVVQPAVAAIAAGQAIPVVSTTAIVSRAATGGASARQTTDGRTGKSRARRGRTSAASFRESAVLRPRAYRRLPDDLVETFTRLGSVTKVAAHYEVPRHTAQGWINRLRSRAIA